MFCFFLVFWIHFVFSEIYFEENFEDGESWKKRWTRSVYHKENEYYGTLELSAGKWYGDLTKDVGIEFSEESRHYVFSSPLRRRFDTDGRDLVIQYSVKFQQESIDCVGAYIKLGSNEDMDDLSEFSENTGFSVMFGPDVCGSNEMIRFLISYKSELYEYSRRIIPMTDEFTHVYTLWMKPDNTFEILIDGNAEQGGDLELFFDLPNVSKYKRDKTAKKPPDWVDKRFIPDPSSTRPADWDEEQQGERKVKLIKNPDYKGPWKAPKIINPNYEEDRKFYRRILDWIGIEIWSMKSGTILDNFLITDDINFAKMEIQKIKNRKIKEKEMFERKKEEKRKWLSEEREKNLQKQRERNLERKAIQEREKKEKELQEKEKFEKIRKIVEKEEQERKRIFENRFGREL